MNEPDLLARAEAAERRYHDLRDAVLAWCDQPNTVRDEDGYLSIVWPDKAALRALVARVDGSGNGAGSVADGAP